MQVAHGPLKCGKPCRKCDYLRLGLCTGCHSSRRNLCLVYQCIVGKVKIVGLTLRCRACQLASACVKSGRFVPPKGGCISQAKPDAGVLRAREGGEPAREEPSELANYPEGLKVRCVFRRNKDNLRIRIPSEQLKQYLGGNHVE